MRVILLCGGIGRRNLNYSFPKPLNLYLGKPLIYYVLKDIPFNDIIIIYNDYLKTYNFEPIVSNLFRDKTFHYVSINYLTRGPVETAYIGIQQIKIDDKEPILFMDNDSIHDWTSVSSIDPKNNFLFYADQSPKPSYSFIRRTGDYLKEIKEKSQISNEYCCGLYGFINKSNFLYLAKKNIEENNKTKGEFYFSLLYDQKEAKPVQVFKMDKTKHLGSLKEIVEDQTLRSEKRRICFDLDNTLVTYPVVPFDYSTVKPIDKNIDLCRSLHAEGHTIIIHTARRMATCQNNVGMVMKQIGRVTLDTLEKYKIPYDELIFGKPIADVYIDDRAVNPYFQTLQTFGFDVIEPIQDILNKLPNNRYNAIVRQGNRLIKTGDIKGECYFYQNVVSPYIPCFHSSQKHSDGKISITLDYIESIPLYFLFKNEVLTKELFQRLLKMIKTFHGTSQTSEVYKQTIFEDIRKNYTQKLAKRFEVKEDYPFERVDEVYQFIQQKLNKYLNDNEFMLNPVIHGDLWFSNILFDYNDNFVFIDMKGNLDGSLTVAGDIYYDYAKIYQSLLGFDLCIHGGHLNPLYSNFLKEVFYDHLLKEGLNIHSVELVCLSLIFGSFHAYERNHPGLPRLWGICLDLYKNLY